MIEKLKHSQTYKNVKWPLYCTANVLVSLAFSSCVSINHVNDPHEVLQEFVFTVCHDPTSEQVASWRELIDGVDLNLLYELLDTNTSGHCFEAECRKLELGKCRVVGIRLGNQFAMPGVEEHFYYATFSSEVFQVISKFPRLQEVDFGTAVIPEYGEKEMKVLREIKSSVEVSGDILSWIELQSRLYSPR